MSNDKSQYNGQNGNGYQPLPCAPTPPPGPEVAPPTLSDVQPGGRVRLGDDLLPCPFCGGGDAEMQQCQAEHYVQCLECEGATALFSSRREARELWNRRAALSAQPSPGGQGDAWDIAELVRTDLDRQSCPDAYMRIAMESVVKHLTARQPVGQERVAWASTGATGHKVVAMPGLHKLPYGDYDLYAAPPAQAVGEPLRVHVPRHEASPYFECTPDQWSQHTHGMTAAGKNMLANMLAHHLLLARRDELGWIITRDDLIAEGRPWWHVSNDGKLTYDYDPATKERKAPAPPAQAVDLGPGIEAAAKLIQKKADDYAEEFGYDDMGGLSFGRGLHAEVKSDHHSFMLELVDELRALIDSQAVGK